MLPKTKGKLVLISNIISLTMYYNQLSQERNLLKVTETKPSLVNQQCIVFEYKSNSCGANYIDYTNLHLHLCIEEYKYSVIGKHHKDKHSQKPNNLHEQLAILEKCQRKFECLIYEML